MRTPGQTAYKHDKWGERQAELVLCFYVVLSENVLLIDLFTYVAIVEFTCVIVMFTDKYFVCIYFSHI